MNEYRFMVVMLFYSHYSIAKVFKNLSENSLDDKSLFLFTSHLVYSVVLNCIKI